METDSFWNWIIGVALIGVIASLIFSHNTNDQINDYSRTCNDATVLENYSPNSGTNKLSENEAITECKEWNDLTQQTYIVNRDTQSVSENINGVLTKTSSLPCIVENTENWSCANSSFGFSDGKYFNYIEALPTEHFGLFTYLWYKIIPFLPNIVAIFIVLLVLTTLIIVESLRGKFSGKNSNSSPNIDIEKLGL